MHLGKSQREKKPKEVASVAAFTKEGLLLFGKRNDSGKWTLPGGHLEPDEVALDGAKRELKEESGLEGKNFQFLGSGLAGKDGDIIVHCYSCEVDGEPSGSEDPDEECDEWRWVETKPIPGSIMNNLHSPKNITLRLLGFQDGDVEKPLAKKADPHWVETKPMSGSGISIPKMGTESRKGWDKSYLDAVVKRFASGDHSKVSFENIPTEISGTNMPVNKSRLNLYVKMLRGKDILPPVVVRRMGNSYHLIDGNHRQEAYKRAGINNMPAIVLGGIKKSEELEKALLPAALLSANLIAGAAMPNKQPEQQNVASIESPSKWSPEGLSSDLYPIAHLESSWGKNIAHARNSKGDFHTAYGALGFKPVTAHEEYMKSKYMQGNYPGLENPDAFLSHFKNNPKFYNLLASAHFERLKHRHGGPTNAAYAWRWGTGATAAATPDQIKNDAYVQKYAHMNLSSIKKNSDLDSGSDISNPDTSFDFGANDPAADELHQKALKSIARMHPEKQKMAQSWIAFARGHTQQRPQITPDLERHLARFGIVDPAGYSYDSNGRSLNRPLTVRRTTGKEPDNLRQYRLNSRLETYDLPYQKSEENLVEDEDLEKGVNSRLFPVTGKEVSEKWKNKLSDWVANGRRMTRESLPSEKNPSIRQRSITRLAARTPTRVGPSGEMQYLLHRGMSASEAATATGADKAGYGDWYGAKEVKHDSKTSWTPNYDEASRFANQGAVVSAWIPHSAIHSVPMYYDGNPNAEHAIGEENLSVDPISEHEVIVNPHKSDIATTTELRNHFMSQMPLKERNEVRRNVKSPAISRFQIANTSNDYDDDKKFYLGTKKFEKRDLDPNSGYKISHSITSFPDMYSYPTKHFNVLTVDAHSPNGEHVGRAVLGYEKDGLVPAHIHVVENHRRKGIASALYNHAEKETGLKVQPSKAQTDEGEALWASPGRTFGKSEEDPIETLLNHENPTERILALKSKEVTPYHLRLAINDEDPSVREFAALHPMMTSEMIKEGLRHPDLHTRECFASRPDLKPEHLEIALWDPDLQTKIARHAALTNEQKEKLKAAPYVPEGLKVELANKSEVDFKGWLSKNSPEDLCYNSHTVDSMMGLTKKVDVYVDVAKFIAGFEPDRQLFRQALLADRDLIDAALLSIGRDTTEKDRKDFVSILKIKQASDGALVKSERAHEVKALMPDGDKTAEDIRNGFGSNTEEKLHLGGKHSSGALLVRDQESGQMYLIKPGSGKQSPALGAREESANQSRREAAFWHVVESWGIGKRYPRADLILLDGKEVAALHMLPFDWKNFDKLKDEDPGLITKVLEKYRETGELHKWAIADFILGNVDRHGQNLMVGPEKEDYPLALIDHGSAFAGNEFDPAHDKNTFIPYYLRAWRINDWGSLDVEQKLRGMPSLPERADNELKEWFQNIHADTLEATLHRYGINPEPTLKRFAKVKGLLSEKSFSEAINALWVTT